MVNIIIIHGAFGNPEENWFPWIKNELENLGHNVYIPKFPTPENQNLESWRKIFKDYEQYLNEDCIVIGHSLGPAFLLNILENINFKIKGAFFVAGFLNLLGNNTFDSINKTFIDNKFNFEKIRNNCEKFFVYHSDNDPYIPIKFGEELAEKVNGNFVLVENAGHFNEISNYIKFNLLLEDIKKLLNK